MSINSSAVRTPELVTAVANRLGSCATVVNIDPKRVVRDGRETWEVFVNGGRVPTGLEAVAWAKRVWSIASEMKSAGNWASNSAEPACGQPHCANGIAPESNQQSITSGTRRMRAPFAKGES